MSGDWVTDNPTAATFNDHDNGGNGILLNDLTTGDSAMCKMCIQNDPRLLTPHSNKHNKFSNSQQAQ